ncbi:MAG: hypothetical protein AAFO81_00100 [Pseudomonadota bacterium]
MRLSMLGIGVVSASLVAGCGDSGGPETEQAAAPVIEPDTRLTDAVNETLDKAKAVEDAGLERKAEMDARLQQLESGDDKDEQP